jgi:thimet oligopeptidase
MLRFSPDLQQMKALKAASAIEMQQQLFAAPLDFSNLSVDKINGYIEQISQVTKITYDEIASCQNLSFATVMQPLINLDLAINAPFSMATLPMYMDNNAAVREVSSEAGEKLEKIKIEHNQREDVYNIFNKYYAQVYPQEYDNLTVEENRYVAEMHRNYRRCGLGLKSKINRDEVAMLKNKLAELQSKFIHNINEDKTSFEIHKSELAGLPDTWFTAKRLIKDDIYKVTLKTPDVEPIQDFCQNRSTRAKIYLAFWQRCEQQNLPLLLEAVQLRQRMASILGYKSYADYCAELRMSKTADKVQQFLDEMNERFLPIQMKTINDLTAFASEVENDPNFELQLYDVRYYAKMREKHMFAIDHKEISEYFPAAKVVAGTMAIYQKILGLRFELADTETKWDPAVNYYNVFDTATNSYLGSIYLDLYPREGKYAHAAVSEMIDGADLSKFTGQAGVRLPHKYVMYCNFPKDEGISFKNVITFFHEFGHLMHGICSLTQLGKYRGMQNERDFVEAPSQMLENWCYNPAVLAMLSAHKDTGLPIPVAKVAKIKESETVHEGYFRKRQLTLSTFDFSLHCFTAEQLATLDLKQYWSDLQQRISLMPAVGDCLPASFNHLMGGYESGYYGYMYSQVVALDMFATMFAADPLNVAAGMRYRKCILEPGGTKDAIELVRDFLGRDPQIDAFLQEFGLQAITPNAAPAAPRMLTQ